MNYQNNLLLNISVLYRNTQKYFDKNLAAYNLGSGQMIFLLLINEHEGITMQQLAIMGDFDKGTTTKSIQKLAEEGYIEIIPDENDKRVKRIYTTKKTGGIINDLYNIRNDCVNQLTATMSQSEIDEFLKQFQTLTNNGREIMPQETYAQLKIGGLQKLTLLDYPNQVACTVFTAGCNMKCPFCHNRDLVFIPENFDYIKPEDVIDFLSKRAGILDGVCITGGEPLLQQGLLDFIQEIKNLGYKVKVDTNGMYPDKLKELVESGLVDYVAMDVKNTLDKYPLTTGLPELSGVNAQIKKSIKYLLSDVIDYEFRTTVVRELHSKEDMVGVAKMLKGAKRYYLQQFVDSGKCIENGLSGYDREEMEEILKEVQAIIPEAQLRGV